MLTDKEYFAGTEDDLRAVQSACQLPVLRKDFIVAEPQVLETRAMGADAMLAIVAVLKDTQLKSLINLAESVGLDVLVETHSQEEVHRALDAGAQIVGINNRSLADFSEDLGLAEKLLSEIPDSVVKVAESAIRSVEDAQRMSNAGFEAILVGEALVKAAQPEDWLRSALAGSER